jgi:hypothetical protein
MIWIADVLYARQATLIVPWYMFCFTVASTETNVNKVRMNIIKPFEILILNLRHEVNQVTITDAAVLHLKALSCNFHCK